MIPLTKKKKCVYVCALEKVFVHQTVTLVTYRKMRSHGGRQVSLFTLYISVLLEIHY